ncbi:pleiotropic drug resistance protein 3-like [Gossypium australe]|uniref:Pleiotropic drug resistance protein 3-like n=1 Tax=Gossypium australe TaxID=47621 RepID=A0A5B6X517_9ROSI|nr:pleiotropic drug resistance protein 3-like [Gossypium australe]
MESDTVKQYLDRIMAIVNSIKLLGARFGEAKIVEKVISILPERYKAKISSLEDSRDLSSIYLTELINALYAQEYRKASRHKANTDLLWLQRKKTWPEKTKRDRLAILKQPAGTDLMCSARFVNRWAMLKRIAKRKASKSITSLNNLQHKLKWQKGVVIRKNKRKTTKGWLIDNGCTNHMTPNATIFKSINRSFNTRLKVGNGHYIKAEGKGDVLIDTPSRTKLISNVLLVLKIDRNLLSIAQLVEKGYSVVFKGKECLISDPSSC